MARITEIDSRFEDEKFAKTVADLKRREFQKYMLPVEECALTVFEFDKEARFQVKQVKSAKDVAKKFG